MYSHPPPPYYNKKYRKRSCGRSCCRCICCFCCFLFILVLLILATTFILWSIYDPKLPIYNIQDLKVKAFNVTPDLTLNTELELSVQADNPNKHLGIFYGDNNSVEVLFKEVRICSGNFPSFRQGPKNTTIFNFGMKGNTKMDSTLQKAYNETQTKHFMPLVMNMKVPVRVLIGETRLREVRAILHCIVVVENLAPNSTNVNFAIKETNVHFEF